VENKILNTSSAALAKPTLYILNIISRSRGWWPSTTDGKTVTLMERKVAGQVQVLGSFGDTVFHLPYLNRPFLSGSPFPSPTFRPFKLVTWQPTIPNGS
jgi:hypothetical protein